MAFQFPPKPWTNGQLFETENADGTSLIGIYNESKNLWSFERTTESGASSLVTTRDVRTLKTRPSVVPNPFDPNLDEFVNQQETNWFLWDGIQGVLRTGSATPGNSPYNSFWFNEDQKVLYVWDVDQWVKAAPDADIFEGFTVNGSGGGGANDSGDIVIKQSGVDAQDGRLYLKNTDNTTNISLFGASGNVDLKGILSFTGTNTNKNIRAYGADSPVIKFLTGSQASNVVERMSIAQSGVTVNTNLIGNFGISGLNLISSGTTSVGQNLIVNTTSDLKGDVTAEADVTIKGATHTQGTAKFTNQTAMIFEYNGDQSIITKDDILYYGLKADNSKPSWEACRIGIDPNNENFSAFTTGKRFYWNGTYAYLNGSLRNYLGNAAWDFRDNETDNNIVLSIDKTKVEYGGSTSTPSSIQTKASVDSAITDTALGASYLTQDRNNNNGSTLDGQFLLEYSKSSTGIVNVIVDAKNSTSITEGKVVGILPVGYRPAYKKWILFRLINPNQTVTAECIIENTGVVKFLTVSGATTELAGQTVFSTTGA